MAKFTHLTNVTGRIARKGLLQLTTPTVGLYNEADHKAAWAESDLSGTDPNYGNYSKALVRLRRAHPGNIRVLKIGAGAKALGFNAHTWFFVIDGRAYARLAGNGNSGQYFRSGGRWHTEVRALRGKQRAAVLAAAV